MTLIDQRPFFFEDLVDPQLVAMAQDATELVTIKNNINFYKYKIQQIYHKYTKKRMIKLNDFKDIPEAFKKEISDNYPEYVKPPPVDDNRTNETSWTYFKRTIKEKGGPEKIKRQ